MPEFELMMVKLAAARAGLFLAADAVPVLHWQARPHERSWSAAEVLAHLTMVERATTASAGRIIRHPPKPARWSWRLPLALVSLRVVRQKTPIPLDLALIGQKEEMLAGLRETRARTLAFLDETRARDLRAFRWRHPIIGFLNFYEWFHFLAHHEVRHTKQIRAISDVLPNPVEELQK